MSDSAGLGLVPEAAYVPVAVDAEAQNPDHMAAVVAEAEAPVYKAVDAGGMLVEDTEIAEVVVARRLRVCRLKGSIRHWPDVAAEDNLEDDRQLGWRKNWYRAPGGCRR